MIRNKLLNVLYSCLQNFKFIFLTKICESLYAKSNMSTNTIDLLYKHQKHTRLCKVLFYVFLVNRRKLLKIVENSGNVEIGGKCNI